jgi:hypothetical protein
MAREAGRSQGFGRVSPETRPSPYSPLHFRGSFPAARNSGGGTEPRQMSPLQRLRRTVGRRMAVLVVLAAVVAGIGYLAVFRSPVVPTRAVVAPALPASAVKLDDEALRLARSAIAASRR